MTVNFEKRIISELKVLKDKEFINKSTYKSTKPVDFRQDILYRLDKTHKEYHLFVKFFQLLVHLPTN